MSGGWKLRRPGHGDLRHFEPVVVGKGELDFDGGDVLLHGLEVDIQDSVGLAVEGPGKIPFRVHAEEVAGGLGQLVGEFGVNGFSAFLVHHVVLAVELEVPVVEVVDEERELVPPVEHVDVGGEVIDV